MRALALASIALLCGCSPSVKHLYPVNYNEECLHKIKFEDTQLLRAALPTDAGMHALWSPNSYRNVCSFEAWEASFLIGEEFEPHIRRGSLVPIYIASDGIPLIELRVGSATDPASETVPPGAIAMRRSKPYLFNSTGAVALSGIEYIGGEPDDSARAIKLPFGRWQATVIEIGLNPGVNEEIAKEIPNFVVLLNPEVPGSSTQYRQERGTFE